MSRITLIIPGLLPIPDVIDAAQLPGLPGLQRLLARADRFPLAPDYLQLLLTEFGLPTATTHADPSAALAYLHDTGQAPAGFCLRADPVHLEAGRNGLVLLEGDALALGTDETRALMAAVQPLIETLPAAIEAPVPERWYLHLPQLPGLQTTPLHDVAGRDIGNDLPTGADQRTWRGLLNEIQMTLHDHPVNEARRAHSRPEINSVWFWGLGSLPGAGATSITNVYADDPVVRGLAALHDVAAQPLPTDADVIFTAARATDFHGLVLIDQLRRCRQYGDFSGWLGMVESLQQHWLAPLLKALGAGRLEAIRLLLPGQGYHLRRWHRWCFWRKKALKR